MSKPGTEYLRRIKFSCPVCLNSVTEKVWVEDTSDLKQAIVNCPVCGSPTLRIDSPDDDIQFFAYLDMRRTIIERINELQEDTYDYL
ncbi:hypothetical protein Mlab_1463 [Methanocorpusculum labreanum Z]|uniref:Uncharacterized protein n=1 Tax=Methanocorpusculum labreanum (strain ATCC 43576 / DSM 4855 / Z) TaxID=410358 RepID=A2STH2_METLZ|nr:hypothetical protein [Methanocorpusculum labreanum]ABN07628.1 hypothetical protein Mlab_1463 [Methanocorpusculum labreanum Z]